jgi:hypothetical protein
MAARAAPSQQRGRIGEKLNRGRTSSCDGRGGNQARLVASHHTTPAIVAKKIATPITIEKFTFVVRLWGFISGKPVLSLSMDMEKA